MTTLLELSRRIDALSAAIGRAVSWLVPAACLIATATAILGKLFSVGSNAWLEVQWLLFGAIFLFAAPWTLALNQHVRIDILNQRLSRRTRDLIDIGGHVLFLLPMAAIIIVTSVPFALGSYSQHEGSSNFGGLPQWPLKMLIPAAFMLLFAQGLSELIKRVAIVRGDLGHDAARPYAPPAPRDLPSALREN